MAPKILRYKHILNSLDSILDSLPDIVFFKSPEGVYLKCNKKYLELRGKTKEEVLGKSDCQLYPEEADFYMEMDRRIAETGMPIEFGEWVQYPDGRQIYVHSIKTAQYDNKGNLVGILGIGRDITEQKLMEQKLAERESYLSTILETTKEGFSILEMNGKIVEVNNAFCEMTGYDREELIGMNIRSIDDKFGSEGISDNIRQIIEDGSTMLDTIHRRKDGSIHNVEVSVTLLDRDKRLMVCFTRDITDRKLEMKEKESLSYIDHLTGLFNRRYLEKELRRLDNPSSLPLAVLAIDVNDLKLTNDAFGHQGGDELLREVGDVLRRSCRDEDILGRAGGDEFVIYLPRTSKEAAEKVKERILKETSETRVEPMVLSLSVGIAVKKDNSQQIGDILKEADNSMYYDKVQFARARKQAALEKFLEIIFTKTPYEKLHAERVSELSFALAKETGLSEDRLVGFKDVAYMHDIGKISISENILNKPNKLTLAEWDEIKHHPAIGYRILKGVEGYSFHARAILYHHERWDGTGYPMGAKGDRIPILSRILAIADAYEAMTADRPYRGKMSDEEAVEELKNNSGIQFDPELVEIFIEKVLRGK